MHVFSKPPYRPWVFGGMLGNIIHDPLDRVMKHMMKCFVFSWHHVSSEEVTTRGFEQARRKCRLNSVSSSKSSTCICTRLRLFWTECYAVRSFIRLECYGLSYGLSIESICRFSNLDRTVVSGAYRRELKRWTFHWNQVPLRLYNKFWEPPRPFKSIIRAFPPECQGVQAKPTNRNSTIKLWPVERTRRPYEAFQDPADPREVRHY